MTPLDERLSRSFTWGEMTRTSQTSLQDKNREEAEKYKRSLTALAAMLQVVRDHWGSLRVNSAFRGPTVNAKVGGAKSSQHLVGEAVDFVPMSENVPLEVVFEWICRESGLPFGQLILERPGPTSEWIHLSLGAPWRKARNGEALHWDGRSYTPAP